MSTAIKDPISIGSMTQMRVHIDAPLKMDADLDIQNLVLLCGANGSGKSLALKLNWIVNMVTLILVKHRSIKTTPFFNDVIQKLFDKSFDAQNFNGTVGADYDSGSTVSIILEKGKVKDVLSYIDCDITEAPTPIFMSTDMRTFESIHRYLAISKSLPKDSDEILNHYKIYDCTYVDLLKTKIGSEFLVTPALENTFKQFDLESKNFESFHYDPDKNIFCIKVKDKPEIIDLATFSKGEQSIINISLGTHIHD